MKVIEFQGGKVVILDQTLLPNETKYIECSDIECVCEAIKSLRVRGAPAIGAAAAFGMALTAVENAGKGRGEILEALRDTKEKLKETRPTAVNLEWAVERVYRAAKASKKPDEAALKEALRIYDEAVESDNKIGEYGAELITDGDVILTHCNAGGLATCGIGTALGVIKTAARKGKKIEVFADETRPLLQGARLTAYELVNEGIPVNVITDNAAAFAMKNMGITKVVVGADRIAANGDTANKIGTYGVAVLAKEHGIPFYVAAPLSTIDRDTATGDEIPIEFRDASEIIFFNEKRVVADGAGIKSPAFDVTPHKYITGIITERGVLKPPFDKSIKQAFEK
ncbi:S-methyl-5-thioribose-1-phosphate isomerase [archaeon]|nr:S-methyl-5-thioribose-1-phosphate isomerase [archaeon]